MIGQSRLRESLDELIVNKKFPRFTIIYGAEGSGKRTLISEVFNRRICMIARMENTVDDVRFAISQAYKPSPVPVIYIFANAQELSRSAQNALLKVTEEPPNNAYFILTVTNRLAILDTLRSRAREFFMEPYTADELKQFMDSHYEYTDNEEFQQIALDICDVPGEIELLYERGAKELKDFTSKVMDNIAEVSVSNALKMTESIAFNGEEDKFDLMLFWKSVIAWCIDYIKAIDHIDPKELRRVADVVATTREYIDTITVTKGANKRNAFDMWILDMRKIMGEENGSN